MEVKVDGMAQEDNAVPLINDGNAHEVMIELYNKE